MPLSPSSSAYEVYGPRGGLCTRWVLPPALDRQHGSCPAVVMMHGFLSDKEQYPLPQIAEALAQAGIASLLFDFDAHGQSEGEFVDMCLSSELADARAVLAYAASQPFVRGVALLGHSQGGVLAGMLAGELEGLPGRPACIVQLAPAAVLRDDALAGRCLSARYDPVRIPESVQVFSRKVGRAYFAESQTLPVYETSARYSGKVCIVQGELDTVVPVVYSEKYHQLYPDSELHVLKGEGHLLNGDKAGLLQIVTEFLKENLR